MHDPNIQDSGSFVGDSNQGFMFMAMKPRNQRKLSVDGVITELRPKMFSIPGVMAFLQNPPPITVSGQQSTSVYQMTLQSANLQEIYQWVPPMVAAMRALPGFVDVNSDLQVSQARSSWWISIAIARNRSVYRRRRSKTRCIRRTERARSRRSFTPANQYAWVIMEVQPPVPAESGRAVKALISGRPRAR